MKPVFLQNTLYATIKQHKKLAEKRSPLWDQNRFAKFMIYFMVAFWMAYLILFGVLFAFMFEEVAPSMEPYHLMNRGLPVVLVLDFLLRLWVQPTPSQEVKPYLLFPIAKRKLIATFLLQSGLSSFNLLWMALMLPFGFLTVIRFFGFGGLFTYMLGFWLLIVANNYWTALCKTLIRERIVWIVLPLAVYGLLAALEFLPDGHPVSTFTMNLGEGYILGSPWAFLLTLVGIIALYALHIGLQQRLIYRELGRVEDTQLKHVSQYTFLDRFGEIGDYLRLELKLITRNKVPRNSMLIGLGMMIMFTVLCGFTDAYDGMIGTSFTCTYCYVIMGILTLTNIMGFEGNYLDGLMARKEVIFNLLRAKYYLNCLITLIPFLLMLVPVWKGKFSLLMSVSYYFVAVGPCFAALFQLAVYNKHTIVLNSTVMRSNRGGTMIQNVITTGSLLMPMILLKLSTLLLSQTTACLVLLVIGVAFAATHRWWLMNIYRRFMARRYENMEGFRSSRG